MIRALLPSMAALVFAAAPAAAETGDFSHAVGTDLFASTDAEDTSVVKAGINFDLKYESPEHYLGVRLEKAWFRPLGENWKGRERVYVRAADNFGQWKGAATIGTDGDTVIGSATIHDEAGFRKEFFIERELVETPQGLDRGIYYTFVGAALDLPVNDRNIATVVAGVQDFTGSNVRKHLRATFVHVADPDAGLSVQLRTRYFHDSHPREFDYYSPRWYAQVLPVVQLRRFSKGWMYLVAGGIGVQRDSSSDWRRSSYLNAQVKSPPRNGVFGTASILFSETPTVAGSSYNYAQATAALTVAF